MTWKFIKSLHAFNIRRIGLSKWDLQHLMPTWPFWLFTEVLSYLSNITMKSWAWKCFYSLEHILSRVLFTVICTSMFYGEIFFLMPVIVSVLCSVLLYRIIFSLCNLVNIAFNPLMPKISLVILLTVCHTILMMLVLRIWYWIN